ncbi:MAG: hypothetical protein RL490_2328 [Pseudomonadota bacterium]|jgi:hypothetical protein
MTLRRNARGKRPQFHDAPGLDQAMSMILVLAQEFSALRDRLDTVERVASAAGLGAAIEAYRPPQAVLEEREARRQAFLERLYYLARKDAAEAAENDSSELFTAALDDIAKG